MANPNAAFGLRRATSYTSAKVADRAYAHPSSDGTALFIGDPVVTNGDSTSSSSSGVVDGTPYVTASGTITTTAIRGFVTGVRPKLTDLTLQYCPASTEMGVMVCDDPNVLVEIMDDGTAAHGDVSGNIAITSGSGSTVTGLSAYVAHEAALGSTNVLRIVRMAPIVNNVMGANAILQCIINQHELKSTSGT
jgi:hypothetical protein